MPTFNKALCRRVFFLFAALAYFLGLVWGSGLRLQVTPSMPPGLYQVVPGDLQAGDLVAYCLPPGDWADTARSRGYLQSSNLCLSGLRPVIKTLAGLPGDVVDTSALAILPADSLSRPLASALADGVIPEGYALLLSPRQDSFDSRYFGLVPLDDLERIRPVYIPSEVVAMEEYLSAAAAAVMRQITDLPGLAVPVDPAVAEYMGLAEDDRFDPADYEGDFYDE